jgi:hypothetical protein
MKHIFIYVGLLLLILNSIFGLISSTYKPLNWISNDIIIICNTLLLGFLANSKLKDGFKISMSFILPIIGLIQLIFGLFLNEHSLNSLSLISIIGLFGIQIFFLLIGKVFSKYA